jgi:hypothetical protein
MKRKPLIIGAIIVVLVAAWGLFRPELLFVNKSVNESFPAATSSAPTASSTDSTPSTPELSGQFHTVLHDTKGTASIFKLQNGQRVLRLTDFMTSNGPDVRVLLVAAADASSSDAVTAAGSVELGKLKGNTGDQNYDIPAGLDLAKYRAVTIWCHRFNANFGTAPLTGAMMESASAR